MSLLDSTVPRFSPMDAIKPALGEVNRRLCGQQQSIGGRHRLFRLMKILLSLNQDTLVVGIPVIDFNDKQRCPLAAGGSKMGIQLQSTFESPSR